MNRVLFNIFIELKNVTTFFFPPDCPGKPLSHWLYTTDLHIKKQCHIKMNVSFLNQRKTTRKSKLTGQKLLNTSKIIILSSNTQLLITIHTGFFCLFFVFYGRACDKNRLYALMIDHLQNLMNNLKTGWKKWSTMISL